MAENEAKTSRALATIKELLDAGRPLIYIQSPEESRVDQLLAEAATRLFPNPVPVYTWTATEGMRRADGCPVEGETARARAALDFIAAHEGAGDLPAQGLPSSRCRNPARSDAACATCTTCCFDTGKFVFLTSPDPLPARGAHRAISSSSSFTTARLPEMIDFLNSEAERLAGNGVTLDTDPGTLRSSRAPCRG